MVLVKLKCRFCWNGVSEVLTLQHVPMDREAVNYFFNDASSSPGSILKIHLGPV